jgi:hypothetical protein
MSQFPVLIVRNFTEIADGLAAVKDFRGISNEELESLTGLCAGSVDKILGPQRVKGIGKNSLPWLMAALGVRFVLIRDFAQEQIMRSRWQGRNRSQVRVNAQPLSINLVERAKPKIFSEYARRSALVRLAKIPPAKRSKIARRAAIARWKRRSKPEMTA